MRGTYTILLALRRTLRLSFGKLGCARLGRGYYLYTGSALGRGAVSLEGRLSRHNRRVKKAWWHIDYLTSRPECVLTAAVYLTSGTRLECKINRSVCIELNVELILSGLGSSDCKCSSHLVKADSELNEADLLSQLEHVYSRFGVPVFVRAESKLAVPLPIASRKRP